jgi:hypothetical protein
MSHLSRRLTVILTAAVMLSGALALRPVRADGTLLPDLGEAPELTNDVWINSDKLRLADLRGKVVLLEFWTFG